MKSRLRSMLPSTASFECWRTGRPLFPASSCITPVASISLLHWLRWSTRCGAAGHPVVRQLLGDGMDVGNLGALFGDLSPLYLKARWLKRAHAWIDGH